MKTRLERHRSVRRADGWGLAVAAAPDPYHQRASIIAIAAALSSLTELNVETHMTNSHYIVFIMAVWISMSLRMRLTCAGMATCIS
jgi:hypothetical protein